MSKNSKKHTTKTTATTKYGNWHRLCDWSHAAQMCHQFTKSKQWHDSRKVREMIEKSVLRTVVEETTLAPIPQPIAAMIRNDERQLGMIVRRAKRLLDAYGDMSLVYVTGNRGAGLTNLSQHGRVYLGAKGLSMPLREFIYYFKDGASYAVLSEWSGIPQFVISDTYEEILTFLWRELREMPVTEEELSFTFSSEVGIHFHGHCDVQFIYNGPHAGGGGKLPSP